ncbi:Glycosyl transferases group 1 [Butyrivibrio sp. TB]|nr:Glycosyl transferases group 1 [Butyrivibrio sp. TB]
MQACGIPVVTRKKHGLLSTVINGKTGYLFNTRNDFKTSLIKLLKNGKVNKEYSQQARIFVTEEFDYRNVIDQWLNVFNDIEENIKTYAKFSKRDYLNGLNI